MDLEIKMLFDEAIKLNPLRTINNCDLGYFCINNIIDYLSCHDNVTSGELATFLKVSTARIANVINTMENNHLVIRCKDTKDKRKVIVKLSEEGKQTYLERYNEAYSMFEKLVDKVGISNMEEFLSYVKLIQNSIEEIKGGNKNDKIV